MTTICCKECGDEIAVVEDEKSAEVVKDTIYCLDCGINNHEVEEEEEPEPEDVTGEEEVEAEG